MNKYLISKIIFQAENRWLAYLMAVRLGIENPVIKKRIEN